MSEWTPEKLPGLTMWIDASEPTVLEVTDGVVTQVMLDKSGNGNHMRIWPPRYIEAVIAVDGPVSAEDTALIYGYLKKCATSQDGSDNR